MGSAFATGCVLRPGLKSSTNTQGENYRAAWMAQGSYGMMVHYLISPQGGTPEQKTAEFNRISDQ